MLRMQNAAVKKSVIAYAAVIALECESKRSRFLNASAAHAVAAIAFAAISQNSICEKPGNSALSKKTCWLLRLA